MISKINNSVNNLSKSLDYFWNRNELLSKNIANANTPGYKRYDIKFDDYLNKEKSKFSIGTLIKSPKFIPIGKDRADLVAPLAFRDESTSMRRDGNNVDINIENAELAKNTMSYNIVANQLSKELSIIKQAIGEGRR
ncbi:MAG: flagellar basal body rod protein FlgB [Firmicutes bacterium]|nr:flagellar basal body rod protein FlgB [Bacillota bacterium]